MLLTFSKTTFETLIKEGVKVHTIRDDKHNRWKVGNSIQFWLGNPRNTRAANKPYQFGTGIVSRVDVIRMDFANLEDWQNDVVHIGENIKLKSQQELDALSVNDGFQNWAQMKQWFVNPDGVYVGKIIFWDKFQEFNK
jgi:hypothetical protein